MSQLILGAGSNISLSGQTFVSATDAYQININASLKSVTLTAASPLSVGSTTNISGTSYSLNLSGNIGGGVSLIAGANISINPSTNASGSSFTISGAQPGEVIPGQTFWGGAMGAIVSNQMILTGGTQSNVSLSTVSNSTGLTVTISAINQSTLTTALSSLQANSSSILQFSSITGANAPTRFSGGANGGVVTNQLMLTGGNQISLSTNTGAGGMTVAISASNQTSALTNITALSSITSVTNLTAVPAAWSFGIQTANASGSTQGVAGAQSAQQIMFYAGSNVTLSRTASSMYINAGGGGDGAGATRFICPATPTMPFYFSWTTLGMWVSGPVVWPFSPGCNATANSAAMLAYFNMPSASTAIGTLGISMGIYTRTGSTLSLASTGSSNYTWNYQPTVNGTNYNNLKLIKCSFPGGVSLENKDYWMALRISSSSSSQTWNWSGVNCEWMSGNCAGEFGAATNNSFQRIPGWGWVTNTSTIPNSIAFSQLVGTQATGVRCPLVYFGGFTA